MLKIRSSQMKALGEYMFLHFVNEMVAHLKENFPEQVNDIAEEQLREIIFEGLKKAESYGIEEEYDMKRYLNLMFTLGQDFDTAKKRHWIKQLLQNKEMSPGERLNRINLQLEQEE